MGVAWPNRGAYSETFIRAHVERLPARVVTLHGDVLPVFTDAGDPLLPRAQRWLDAYVARRSGLSPDHVHTLVARAYPRRWRERSIAAYFRKQRVDVVLAEFGPTGAALIGACEKARIPLVVHFHGQDAYAAPVLEREARGYAEMFRCAAAIIVVSRDMERQVVSLGCPREKLVYNPYGVDTALFDRADPARAPARFVAVGRFVDKKAPHLTLLAFKEVVDRVPDARLVMVGDGPLLEACRQLARALGMEHVVSFPGALPHAEVADLMRQARGFVQHSLRPADGDSEGTPVAVLEAAATGLPVVATRHGGIPDVVLDGETGVLVDEGDVRAMAEALVALARQPARARALGEAARSRIRAEFSIERSMDRLARVLFDAAGLGDMGPASPDASPVHQLEAPPASVA